MSISFNPQECIRAFHEKFKLPGFNSPEPLPPVIFRFRALFLIEETLEYIGVNDHLAKVIKSAIATEMEKPDYQPPALEHQLDALVDLAYVLFGTAYLHGFLTPYDDNHSIFSEAWRRVHLANMSKVRAERASDSARDSIFDVVKPPNFVPPHLGDLV